MCRLGSAPRTALLGAAAKSDGGSMTENTGMRVLVIGAGAIGQAFGHHFQRGGAEVNFFLLFSISSKRLFLFS